MIYGTMSVDDIHSYKLQLFPTESDEFEFFAEGILSLPSYKLNLTSTHLLTNHAIPGVFIYHYLSNNILKFDQRIKRWVLR